MQSDSPSFRRCAQDNHNLINSIIALQQRLTYMATVDEIVRAGILEVYELPDWVPRQPINRLWVAESFWAEFDAMDSLHVEHSAIGGRTIGEHIEIIFNDFRCAERPHAGDLKRMTPSRHGVRKLHPPRARVYGWCPFQRSFVAVTLATEISTKTDRKLNDAKRDEVRAFIKKHKLEDSMVYGDILAVFPPSN